MKKFTYLLILLFTGALSYILIFKLGFPGFAEYALIERVGTILITVIFCALVSSSLIAMISYSVLAFEYLLSKKFKVNPFSLKFCVDCLEHIDFSSKLYKYNVAFKTSIKIVLITVSVFVTILILLFIFVRFSNSNQI